MTDKGYLLSSSPAEMAGEARRISAEEKRAMEIAARPAILRATIQITRAATGKVEEYEIVGTALDESTPPTP